jgi:hypothetical protein
MRRRGHGKELGGALLGEAGEVGACGVEFSVEVVAFPGELVPVGEEVLVLFLEAGPLVGEPGAVGLAELAEEAGGEAPLGGDLVLQVPDFLLRVECPFPPCCILLRGGGGPPP